MLVLSGVLVLAPSTLVFPSKLMACKVTLHFSTPISTISISLLLIRNRQHAQASNAQIHWPYDFTELEVSTSTSSTLDIVVSDGHNILIDFGYLL